MLIHIISIVILFGLAVTIHEMGHLIAAKRNGVKAEKFSIGFGPKLFGIKRGETEYVVSLIPLGGYLKMAGDEPGEEKKGEPWEFFSKSALIRSKIVAAGPLMNLILAYLLTVIVLVIGVNIPEYSKNPPPEIGEVMLGYPAYLAGLKEGDVVLSVDGQNVNTWSEMRKLVQAGAGKELTFSVRRGERQIAIGCKPLADEMMSVDGRAVIGISPVAESFHRESFGWKAPVWALTTTARQIGLTYKMVWMMVSHPLRLSKFMGGPILIAQMSGREAKKGISDLLGFMGYVNIILMVMNLLPIPVLDGGYIMFFAIEGIRKRPLSQRCQERFQKAGLSFLVALMVFLFVNDTLREVNRRGALRENINSGQN